MLLSASFLVLVLGTIVDAEPVTFPPADAAPDSTIVTTVIDGEVEEVVVPELTCYSCTGGVNTENCGLATVVIGGSCIGENAQCYQMLLNIQKGSEYLIQRGCWVPTGNITNYCENFPTVNDANILESAACTTCTGDFCNSSTDFFNATGLFIQKSCQSGLESESD